MKIYELAKMNRYEDRFEKVYYINKENAMKEKLAIEKAYNEAKAKGSGSHWGEVVYSMAVIEEIESED